MTETRQCEDCVYWRPLSWSANAGSCCNYLLDTHRMRQRDGEQCLSRKPRQMKKTAQGPVP